MSELLDLYEDYLRTEKKASANTISSYLRDMHQFEAAMLEQELELTEVLTQEVEHYAAGLTRKGRSAATVTRSIASIKSFYNCMIALGIMDHNPAKGVAPAKVERKLPQILGGAASGAAGVHRFERLSGPGHAGAAVRHWHSGQ